MVIILQEGFACFQSTKAPLIFERTTCVLIFSCGTATAVRVPDFKTGDLCRLIFSTEDDCRYSYRYPDVCAA